ncbi:MAG: hypothetical protein KGH64_04560 [Candidatus Micrarchaeota archaeon]|nr:hypothetical protein [Candidatus Micrarchaeota archaeon]MDE1859138.1 hypothetical protein [Candidatus Micrarchaeota archaeon]
MAIRTRIDAAERQGRIEVIDQNANHAQSMEILAARGLRPLTYQEAFSRSSELIKTLKGKWFYLDGQGIEKSGMHTFNGKGELVELTGNESTDQKVRVWSGNNPLSLVVGSDYDARFYGGRFNLGAYGGPRVVAPVVVGVEIGREAAAPQNGSSANSIPKQVVKDADRTLSKLEKSPFINEGELSAIRELIDAAKGQKRQ